jgi:hypothetical protein
VAVAQSQRLGTSWKYGWLPATFLSGMVSCGVLGLLLGYWPSDRNGNGAGLAGACWAGAWLGADAFGLGFAGAFGLAGAVAFGLAGAVAAAGRWTTAGCEASSVAAAAEPPLTIIRPRAAPVTCTQRRCQNGGRVLVSVVVMGSPQAGSADC